MTFLDELLPLVDAKFEAEERKRRYLDDPVLWAQEYLGVQLWSKQREILYSIRDNRKTAVAAGHGVGKSYVAAIAMAWWIDVHPLGADSSGAPQTFVASTAPFQDQISAILWNNVRILHALSKARFKRGEVDHPLPGYITGDNKWKMDDGTLIGQGRKPPDNKTDSGYQGLHATYLLAIGDEAAGLGSDMIDALGNITTGAHNRLLLIANPTDPTSAMANIWKKKLKDWVRMHISVFDSPLITREPGFDIARAEGLSGQDYIDEKRDEWGEEDPRYIARVLGQWAFDAGNNLFAETDLARAANTVVMPDPEARPRHGWDIARSGKDATVGYRMLEGEIWETDPETGKPTKGTGRRGIQIRYIDHWFKAPLVGSDPDNPSSASRINAYAVGEGCPFIAVDATAMGAGVVDGLRDLDFGKGKYAVFEYWASGAPTDRRAYTNARAQHYFDLKDKCFRGEVDLDPKDEQLFDELRGIVYEYDSKGAKKIESKDDMRKRGVKSPDFADAAIYASFDATPLTENPLAGMRPGEIIPVDPRQIGLERRNRPGMPV
jgi:hypothetical protein